MKKNSIGKNALLNDSTGTGPVTRAKVHSRASELAGKAGRVPPHVAPIDYEQAKRELTGESEVDRQDAILDALPEAKRWDPVPGSEGRQAPESPSEEEDQEGRNESAQLVEEGVNAAERDSLLQADRAVEKPKQSER